MSKSMPKSPDFAAAAAEQAQSSREVTEQQTWANRPTQVTPWGTQSWENQLQWDPSTEQYLNRWTQTTELTPEQQMSLDAQNALQLQRSGTALGLGDRMAEEYANAISFEGFTPMGGLPEAVDYAGAPEMLGPAYGPQYGTEGLNAFGQGPQQGQYQAEQIQRGLDTSGLQQLDPSQRYYQQAGDAMYNQWAERALPAAQMAQQQKRTELYNMGLKEGDQAFDAEMAKLGMQQGDQQRQAAFDATKFAGAEAQRMYGMDQSTRQQQFGEQLQGGQFANQAAQQALQQQLGIGGQQYEESLGGANYANQLRQQQLAEMTGLGQQNYQNQQRFIDAMNAQRGQGLQEQERAFANQMQQSQYQTQLRQQQIAEMMQQRGASLNEINAILHGQQVAMPTMPGFSQAGRAEGTQNLQAAQMQQQADLDAFNAEQQAMQGMMSGISGMAGSFMPMSSRLIKKRIKRIGTTPGGTPIYRFQYLWGGPTQIGVMAEEAPPEAVININGALYVDYSKVT